MPKTKEQLKAYNKEYFARPEVIARAKVRNAARRHIRAAYKLTEAGMAAEKRYRQSAQSKYLQNDSRLKSRYGITTAQYEQMKSDQLGLCAICHKEPNSWHVDHDHASHRVRGLLCGPCNMALGLFKDDVQALARAITYLQ